IVAERQATRIAEARFADWAFFFEISSTKAAIVVPLRLAISLAACQKMRSNRMPRRSFPRETTRNSGRAASASGDAAGRPAYSFTECLFARLVEGLEKIMEDRLAAGHDFHGTDHSGDDRIGFALAHKGGLIGGHPYLIERFAGFGVDQAVG